MHCSYEVATLPFRHILAAPVLQDRKFQQALAILENASWEKKLGAFFSFDVLKSHHDKKLIDDLIKGERLLGEISVIFKDLPDSSLGFHFDCDVHRYGPQDGIGVHTDKDTGEFRFIINLNKKWSIEDGGFWILSDKPDMKSRTKYLPSLNNTGFGFLANVDTFHARSDQEKNFSYSLVIRAQLNRNR